MRKRTVPLLTPSDSCIIFAELELNSAGEGERLRMSDNDYEYRSEFSWHLDRQVILTADQLLPGSAGIAFDQGRAAAIQGLNEAECPYTLKYEPKRFRAWNKGFQSYCRTTETTQ